MTRTSLAPGSRLRAVQSGVPVVIGEYLGGGGQGEVYAADMGGYPMAVKWYLPYYLASDPRLRERLLLAVRRGHPSNTFLWPVDLVVADNTPTFGYVMPLREKRFHGFEEMLGERKIAPSFRVLSTAAYELSDGYLKLHAAGLCYRDISFGNVALDPGTGEIRICDNDNVDVDKTPGSVLGTPMFMAPEIVSGLAAPSTRTDLWSMAVLLFHAFVLHHPLLGRHELDFPILSERAQRKLFGTEAGFIFDPNNHSNEPVPGVHDTALMLWSILPTFLRDLFTQAFTSGLRDPGSRIMEPEWRNAMVHLRDVIMRCPGCRAENFCDGDLETRRACWNCASVLETPHSITISNTRIILSDDAALFPHHVDPTKRLDFSAPVAVFSRHPARPDLVGLQNRGTRPWQAVLPDGQEWQVDHGRTIGLQSGTKIFFGSAEGLVG